MTASALHRRFDAAEVVQFVIPTERAACHGEARRAKPEANEWRDLWGGHSKFEISLRVPLAAHRTSKSPLAGVAGRQFLIPNS